MKSITLLSVITLLFFLITTPIYSQSFCGIYERPDNPDPSELEGTVYMDRFGNYYSEKEIFYLSTEVPQQRQLTGVFDLHFNSFFNTFETQTICQVFLDLSNHLEIAPGGVAPTIRIQRTQLSPGVAGTGSPVLKLKGCGYSDNMAYAAMVGGVDPGQTFVVLGGVLNIATGFQFHTMNNDPNIGTNIDLYTVVLHETLHILGYSSLIGLNGSIQNSGAYSMWDEFLYQDIIDEHLINDAPGDNVCCQIATFNDNLIFPDDIENDCLNEIHFRDGNNIAQVNADYGTNPITDNIVANILSHLDRCGTPGNQYVMFGGILPGEMRRVPQQEEVDILYAMGYPEPGNPDIPCVLLASDDNIAITGNTEILFSELLENDVFPAGSTISFPANEGSLWGHADITVNSNSLSIDNPEYGRYRLTYVIKGCDGECVTAEAIFIYLGNLPPCEPCFNDELFCYGSFEEFLPQIGLGIEPALGEPFCVRDNGTSSSVDIYLTTQGEKVLLLSGGSIPEAFYERIYIPLSSPAVPGCKLNICFDAAAYRCTIPIGVNIYGTSTPNCSDLWETTCNPLGAYNCIITTEEMECQTEPNSDLINDQHPLYPPEYDYYPGLGVRVFTDEIELKTTCVEVVNSTSETWDYLVFTKEITDENSHILFDNLHISSDCCEDEGCGVELIETCKENSVTLTVLENGVPIPMYNADCCVSWSGIPGIPTFTCPPGPGMPAQNFNNIGVAYGTEYCVEIVCKECTFEYCGVAGDLCEPGGGPAGGGGLSPAIQIAPNPANNYLEISGGLLNLGQQWVIYDLSGRALISGNTVTDIRQEINISALPSGLFYLQINSPSGEMIFIDRFIKQ